MTLHTPSVDFYFDIISPFGYFASLRIDALARSRGCEVRWRPILIGVTVLKVMGSRPLLEIPLKGEYIVREAERYARRFGIELQRPISSAPANPMSVMRPLAWLIENEPEAGRRFAQLAFDFYWRQGQDIASLDVVEQIRDATGLAPSFFQRAIEGGRESLRRQVDDAVAHGVFGSPYFIVDMEPFFGVNSLEMLDAWLEAGGW